MTQKTYKIALVGPTHPYKGGIAVHTTELAHQLRAAGHTVSLISWRAQYPKLLYPGEMYVPHEKPETAPFTGAERTLKWYSPLGWLRMGRKLRQYDLVVFVFTVPQFNATSGLAMLKGMGKRRPRTIALCHNVLPHEPRPGDKQLTRAFLSRVDKVLVHTKAQADIAKTLTEKPIIVGALAPQIGMGKQIAHANKLFHNLLFLGVVRPYKGVDILLKALAQTPKTIHLTIAGELWGSAGETIRQLIAELDLQTRVTLRGGYVPADQFDKLFAGADASVLPYRSGTATQNAELAFAHGIPVIATRVGSLPSQVHDQRDGLLCAPNDPIALAAVIKKFYAPGTAARLRANVTPPDPAPAWRAYIQALVS